MNLSSDFRIIFNARLKQILRPYNFTIELQDSETLDEFLDRYLNNPSHVSSHIFIFWVLKLAWTGRYPTPPEHQEAKMLLGAMDPLSQRSFLKGLLLGRKWKFNKKTLLVEISPIENSFNVDLTHTLSFGAVTGIQRVVTKTANSWKAQERPVLFYRYNFFTQTPEVLNEQQWNNISSKATRGTPGDSNQANGPFLKRAINFLFEKLIIFPIAVIFDKGNLNGKNAQKLNLLKSRLLMLFRGMIADFKSRFSLQDEPNRVPILFGRNVVLTEVVYESERVDFYLALAEADPKFQLNILAYDLIPLYYPEVCMVSESFLSYLRLFRVVQKVSAISTSVKNEIEALLQLSGTHRNPTLSSHTLAVSVNRKHQEIQPRKTLVLSVGTIEPRKNQATIVRACLALQKHGLNLRLVLVGNIGWQAEDILSTVEAAKRSGLEVEILTGINDDTLQKLYQECAFTVFCSKAEGFGLPVLESIGQGKVCIASNIPAIREIAEQYPEACVLVNPNSVDEIANAIEHQLKHPKSLNIQVPVKTWEQYSEELYQFFSS